MQAVSRLKCHLSLWIFYFFLSQIEMFHKVILSDKKDTEIVICFSLKLKFQECVTTATHDLYKKIKICLMLQMCITISNQVTPGIGGWSCDVLNFVTRFLSAVTITWYRMSCCGIKYTYLHVLLFYFRGGKKHLLHELVQSFLWKKQTQSFLFWCLLTNWYAGK